MKAIVLVKNTTDPSKAFEVREMPIPTAAAGQVCVKVEAFGLNYADVMAREGLYEDCPPLPAVLGYDIVGRVHALGEGVKGFEVGQRVAALTRFGGYAEYALTDAMAVVPVPEDMDAGVATALGTQYATAWYSGEEMAKMQAGDHVLIQAAAGGVGTALVQMAINRGCIVYGTAGSASKLDYLRKLGVQHPINYNETDFSSYIKQHVGSRGLDLVFDSIGGASVQKGLKLLGSGGRIVCYGVASMSGGKNIFRILKMALGFGFMSPIPLLQTSRGIIGVNMLRIADNRPETLSRVIHEVTAEVVAGRLKPEVGGRYSWKEIAEAHAFLASRKSTGKIVVSWD